MNELSDKFLDEGEIVYAAKADSLHPLPGNQRIMMKLWVGSQRVETLRIYWNNYANYVDVAVGNTTGTFEKMLDNMPEGGYIFQVVSLDKFGNKSLPLEANGNTYGPRFRSSLNNRLLKSVIAQDNELQIIWGGIVDKALGTQVVYTNINGEEVEFSTPIASDTTIITDWKSGLKYNTVFVPEESAIDTFNTAFVDYEAELHIYKKLNKLAWTVEADTYEATGQLPKGGLVEFTIDDDKDTFWHTRHTGEGPTNYPHWLAFDMKKKAAITHVALTSRHDYLTSDFTDFIIQASDDGITWTDYGEFKQPDIAGPQYFAPNKPLTTRYIRIWMIRGTDNQHCHMSEFSAFGNYVE
ncbi:hypothetical protein AwDysgo_06610 [Bacteroidales bacterium]|nr:hypothetical protein AwDysgo_06610 [Bacteroidales bacterium]